MRVLLSILSTIFLFATASAVLPPDFGLQDHAALLPNSQHHRSLNEKIDSKLNIVVIDADEAFDRRTMTEADLRNVFDEKRTVDTRRRKLKGSQRTNTEKGLAIDIEDGLDRNGNIRGSHQLQRRTTKDGSKSSSKSKSSKKGCKSKSKKGEKGEKGSSEGCEPQVVYLDYPANEYFYVDRCYYHYYGPYARYHCGTYYYEAYNYTQEDKDEIQERLEIMFEGYNIEFTQTQPDDEDVLYSTIKFECGYYGYEF